MDRAGSGEGVPARLLKFHGNFSRLRVVDLTSQPRLSAVEKEMRKAAFVRLVYSHD